MPWYVQVGADVVPASQEKTMSKRIPQFVCQECSKKFYTARAAEKASYDGCPGCGGVDVDITVSGMGEVGRCVHGVYLGARCEHCKPGYFGEEKDPLRPEVTTLVAGQLVGPNGKVVCPGVVCRCREGVKTCPMHGQPLCPEPLPPTRCRYCRTGEGASCDCV